MQAQDETEMREWMDAIITSQVLYSNLENGITPPPSPDLGPSFQPPALPFSTYASREPLLSPRIKSAPNSPFFPPPVRSASQPVLASQLPPLSPRGIPVPSTPSLSTSTSAKNIPSFPNPPSVPINTPIATPHAPSHLRLSLQRNKPPALLRSPSMQLVPTSYDSPSTDTPNNTNNTNNTYLNNTNNNTYINNHATSSNNLTNHLNNLTIHVPPSDFVNTFDKPRRSSRRGPGLRTQRARAISLLPMPGIFI